MTSGLERWRGRTAIVTGATSGIGREVAGRLGLAGIRVLALGRRPERLELLAKETADAPAQVLPLRCDLRRETEIVEAVEQARSHFGGVDILVNAAGLGFESSLLDGEADKWRETFEVNVVAVAVLCREVIRDMRARAVDGQVVNISSLAGHRLYREDGVYPASKFALRAMTETLRRELRRAGSRVRVALVSPGLVETEFAYHYYADAARAESVYGAGRPLQPADIAGAVEYVLAQPENVDVNDVLVRPVGQEA